MSVITAYKCDQTGKIFEDKLKYQKHVRNLAAERRRIKKLNEAARLEASWWHDNFWNKVRSLDQLKAAILHHRDVFAANGVKQHWQNKTLTPTPIIEFVKFQLSWSKSVSNTHSCPHNGVTNWGGLKKDAPRGYPGWIGRFDYVVQSYKKQLGAYPGSSDMWKGTRIHSGTGGGGGHKDQEKTFKQSFGFGVNLYAADWPAMAQAYEEARVWSAINNDTRDIDTIVNENHPASALIYD